MLIGYNTNGFAHHRLEEAIAILAELGFQGIALTPDVHHLDPFTATSSEIDAIRKQLERVKFRVVIETGSRYLLDPRRKHRPTLLSPTVEERNRRLFFLKECVTLAHRLGGEFVSFWSGTPDDAPGDEILWSRLRDAVLTLADHAAQWGVRLAFEPEPGMFVATLRDFEQFDARIQHEFVGLTMDVNHLICASELPASAQFLRWRDKLWNVHLADGHRGIHDHLLPGSGELDLADVVQGLQAIEYQGGVYWELSRHSHDAVATARRVARLIG